MKIRISKHDAKWSELVRERDGKCLYCEKTEELVRLNAHHFVRRSVKATRLFLDNGITLCVQHHVFSTQFSAHRTPKKFKRWFKNKFPRQFKQIFIKQKFYMNERQAIKEFENGLKYHN